MRNKKLFAALLAATTLLFTGCDIDKMAEDLDAKIGNNPIKDDARDIANSIAEDFEDAMSGINIETWAEYSTLK